MEKDFFFEKRCPSHRPSWVKTAEIPQEDGKLMTVCLINDLETLIWVENLASLELHVPLSKVASPETPDSMVFDLDPGDAGQHYGLRPGGAHTSGLTLPNRACKLCKNIRQKRASCICPFESEGGDI